MTVNEIDTHILRNFVRQAERLDELEKHLRLQRNALQSLAAAVKNLTDKLHVLNHQPPERTQPWKQ